MNCEIIRCSKCRIEFDIFYDDDNNVFNQTKCGCEKKTLINIKRLDEVMNDNRDFFSRKNCNSPTKN